MYFCWLFVVFGVVVLISMISCILFFFFWSFFMDKIGWIIYCFGCFLIDLLFDVVINVGYYLWGDRIEYLDDKFIELVVRVDCFE